MAPLQCVLAAHFWTLSVHEDIRNTLARPVVEPKLSASDAKFTTITSDRNFGQVDADVVSEATATGVCHIIPMAPGSPLPSGVTNLPYQAVFLEVPPGYFFGHPFFCDFPGVTQCAPHCCRALCRGEGCLRQLEG